MMLTERFKSMSRQVPTPGNLSSWTAPLAGKQSSVSTTGNRDYNFASRVVLLQVTQRPGHIA
jgi:hypothetical protein